MIKFCEKLPLWMTLGLAVGWLFIAPVAVEARESYAQFVQRVTSRPGSGTQFRGDLEGVVLNAVNAYRASKKLPALARSGANHKAARAHAVDMAVNEFVGHRSSSGQEFDSRMRSLRDGALFLPSMGENAARQRAGGEANRAKALKLVEQWIGSPSHRRQMLSRSFTTVATGVVQKGDHLYAVQIFSGPEVKTNVRRAGAATADGVY